jgi:hypothetical protein
LELLNLESFEKPEDVLLVSFKLLSDEVWVVAVWMRVGNWTAEGVQDRAGVV